MTTQSNFWLGQSVRGNGTGWTKSGSADHIEFVVSIAHLKLAGTPNVFVSLSGSDNADQSIATVRFDKPGEFVIVVRDYGGGNDTSDVAANNLQAHWMVVWQ